MVDNETLEGETSAIAYPEWFERSDYPQPVGYQILVELPPKIEKIGQIHITKEQADRESVASILGVVRAIGPDAYADKSKFPNQPWCKVGDWVLFKSYAGIRVMVGAQEVRFLNDDSIVATVGDPSLIGRAI